MPTKMLDLVVNQPTGSLFDPIAQRLLAIGVVIFLLLWGFAKLIEAGRK